MTFVYDLGHRHGLPAADVKALVGGKAANLAVMANELGLPVPPGFVITTAACRTFLAGGWPSGLDAEMAAHMRAVEEAVGRRFGDPANPLLVSVRSGAPVSMPGMMDTILDLGLNAKTGAGLAAVSGDPAFAEGCWERLVRMFTEVVGVSAVPDDPWEQLRAAVESVFGSWNSDRARAYRRHEGIPDGLGTAVTVQAMVYGDLGPGSGTGVVFTRNPSTGEPTLYGDLVFGAQGEDVVAGTHQTEDVAVLDQRLPAAAGELRRVAQLLERHFADLCEIEFTIERGKLWLLQVRQGKRTPQAALRIAVDMAETADFPLSQEQAVRRVARYLLHPPVVWTGQAPDRTALAKGLPASPGVASGEVVTSPRAAQSVADAGRPLILVRTETSPEDVPIMALAAGVITAKGGLASHAAVIARDWGIPAVVGAPVRVEGGRTIVGGMSFADGETLTIDGSTGEIFAGRAPGRSAVVPEAATLLAWAKDSGIDISQPGPGPSPSAPAPAAAASEPVAEDVLRVLAIREAASLPALAAAVQSTPEQVRAVVERLCEQGVTKLAADMALLTETGKARGRQLLADDRQQWGAENAVAALDAFVTLDVRVKETVTAWQLRDADGQVVPNDHSDAAYDASVLDRLTDLHEEVVEWLAPTVAGLGRLATYVTRLGRALDEVRHGDQRFVASARVDSYHTVWFELHEDLIRLSDRTREEEVAAGRA
ncbi:MAG: pyruvate, phosphate dikinase [Acidimicrobiales bacterium]